PPTGGRGFLPTPGDPEDLIPRDSPRKSGHDGGDLVRDIFGPRVGDPGDPRYPQATQCLKVPGLLFWPCNTLQGAPDTTAARRLSPQMRRDLQLAPTTAALAAWGYGDGTLRGYSAYQGGTSSLPRLG